MRVIEDLTGKTFGDLTVVSLSEPTLSGRRRWLCRCVCGNTKIVSEDNLKRGHTKSCGCRKAPDLTGKVFGKLTVIRLSDKRGSRGKRTTPLWECRCECGAITYKASDTLNNPEMSMCAECAGKYSAEKAREGAGFVDGTQISRIVNPKLTASNSSGFRGVYYDKRSNKWRARLKFKGKTMSFGSYYDFDEAVAARKQAERIYFGEFLEEHGIWIEE
ncbi:MAG: AP2 domain-containing protein [Clostridia bacterium]|nr:AP2 domain-containing protein [Clostridia bacterium]